MMKRSRPEALPDAGRLRHYLWREFLNTPGVLERLKGHLEYVKSIKESDIEALEDEPETFQPSSESSRISPRTTQDEAISDPGIDVENLNLGSISEDVTLEEASNNEHLDDEVVPPVQVSVIKPTKSRSLVKLEAVTPSSVDSPRVPPLSPRIIIEDTEANVPIEKAFFLGNNIDQIPERNVSSPREDSLKVPVIRCSRAKSPTTSTNTNGSFNCSLEKGFKTPTNQTCQKLSTSQDFTSPQVSPYLPSCAITQATSFSIDQDLSSTLTDATILEKSRTKLEAIPPFYHPRIPPPVLPTEQVEAIQEAFANLPDGIATMENCNLASFLDVHPYLNTTVFQACYGKEEKGKCGQFISFLQVNANLLFNTPETDRMFHLMKKKDKNYLTPEDFMPFLNSLRKHNHQLEFFRDEMFQHLHDAYLTSVTASMFFSVGAWRTKKMYIRQFRNLNLVGMLEDLDQGEDLNYIDHISYDQFRVFYVKFVQLDLDNDNVLGREEFLEYDEGRLTPKLVNRIFQLNIQDSRKMSYWDWVIFLLADIDKSSPSSLEFWFPVLTMSSTTENKLSIHDLHQFYKDNLKILISSDFVIDIVHWTDIGSQFLDLMGDSSWTLMEMKKKASDKLSHLLDACLNIFEFYNNDENELSTKSDFTNVQKYVLRSNDELD